MLKLLGSVCVLAGGVLAQAARLMERRRQWDTLSDLLAALRRMEEEIRLARTPMPLLLEYLARNRCPSIAAFFNGTGEALRRGELLAEVWRREASRLDLPVDAGRTLEELGGALSGDEEAACKAVRLTIRTLEKAAEERAAERRAEDRRAAALCFSASALLVILLI